MEGGCVTASFLILQAADENARPRETGKHLQDPSTGDRKDKETFSRLEISIPTGEKTFVHNHHNRVFSQLEMYSVDSMINH